MYLDGYQVNEINIKTPEIVTGTGVIHLIDQILLEDSDKKYFNKLDNSLTGKTIFLKFYNNDILLFSKFILESGMNVEILNLFNPNFFCLRKK